LKCKLIYVNPIPVETEIHNQYTEDKTYFEASLLEKDFFLARDTGTIRSLEKFTSKGKLLDIGCNIGTMLLAAKNCGWDAEGIELSLPAAEYMRRELGLVIHTNPLEQCNFKDNTFDAVTMSHTLEHLTNPFNTCKEIYRILKPGGCIYVAVPNIKCIPAKLYGRDWSWLSPPGHLFYFSPRSLRNLLEYTQFRVIKLETMRGGTDNLMFLCFARINEITGFMKQIRKLRSRSRNMDEILSEPQLAAHSNMVNGPTREANTMLKITNFISKPFRPLSRAIARIGRGEGIEAMGMKLPI